MLGLALDLASDVGPGDGIPPDDYIEALTLTLAAVEQPGINVAPSACWFEVADVTGCAADDPDEGVIRRPKFHDITYVWDFGDAANATPSTAASLNMPAAWKSINRAYGMRVAHVFNDPGTYTVTVWAYEPATRRKGRATVEVTVGDPRVVFPATRTIIYNPGNAVDVSTYGYTGYIHITTTWAAVIAARDKLGLATAQILIAPGVTLTNTKLADNPAWANIRIGGLDPDVRPVIGPFLAENQSLITALNNPSITDRIVFGLDFQGDWDSTTETGVCVKPFNISNIPAGSTCLAVTHRCRLTGFNQVDGFVQGSGNPDDFAGFYLMHSELDVTNWRDYGLHGLTRVGEQSTHTAIIACSVAQHVDALSGGDKANGNYNTHGPFRSFGDKSTFLSVNYMFSRNGWSPAGRDADGYGVTADQACIRLNASGTADVMGNVERCALEGSIWHEEQGVTGVQVPGNYVFDKVLQVFTSRTLQEAVEVRYGGTTFRNMLGIMPDVASSQNNDFQRWFRLTNESERDDTGTADKAHNAASQIDIYNCTFIDLRTNTNAEDKTTALRFDDTRTSPPSAPTTNTFPNQSVENNIFEQPNRSPALVPDAPLDMATDIGFVTRHKGPRWGFLDKKGTLAADVGEGAYFTLSYAEVKTTRFNTAYNDNGSATDQVYWLTNAGTRHRIRMGRFRWHAHIPDNFEVTFEASEIRVWNRTRATWAAGARYAIKLDRSSILPPWNPAFSTAGLLVPLARPQAGSAAIASGDTGLKAYDDFFGTVRPATGNARGALLPG